MIPNIATTYDSNNIIGGVAAILTPYIMTTLNVNMALYGILYSVVLNCIIAITDNNTYIINIFENITPIQICIIISIFLLITIILLHQYINYNTIIDSYFTTNDIILKLHNTQNIKQFLDYVKYNSKNYNNPKSIEYGDPNLLYSTYAQKDISLTIADDIAIRSRYHKTSIGTKIYFSDTHFDVNGYYKWEYTNISAKLGDNVKIFNIPYIVLCVTNKTIDTFNIKKYFTNICDKYKQDTNNIITLYNIKVFNNSTNNTSRNVYNCIYNGAKLDQMELEKTYITPFFHERKNLIWNYLYKLHHNPLEIIKLGQVPRYGILAHGPPGTGKSNFAYRIARSLNRHIISIDIKTIKYTYQLYQLLMKPTLEFTTFKPCEVIYVFDEFDNAINYLQYKNKKATHNYTKWCDYMNSYDDTPNINSTQNAEDDKSKSKKYDENTYDTSELTLNDLLEIFQGPVTLEGAIFYATTNNLDYIKEICPALIRPGRLTPEYFGYITQNILSEISKYFFDKDTTIDISNINIPPSHLLEIITQIKMTTDINKQYQQFTDELKKLCIKYQTN